MHSDRACLLTWTVYGTFLPGDDRGWRHRSQGQRQAEPELKRWCERQLKHPVLLLDLSARDCVERAVRDKCRARGWRCFGVAARSNHVHGVVWAGTDDPKNVRDQLKAMATSRLRQMDPRYRDREVWTSKGDIEWLRDEEAIANAVMYVEFAQDRKGRELGGERSSPLRCDG